MYAVTVGALDIDGSVASYSSPGANLLVVAPTEIPTTELREMPGTFLA